MKQLAAPRLHSLPLALMLAFALVIGVLSSAADAAAPGGYVGITPQRAVDTRSGVGMPSAGAVRAGESITVPVAGVGGIPADATAVSVTLTVTEPTAVGYLTAYPGGTTAPTASNLNYFPGQTVANLAMVKTGADGAIAVQVGGAGAAHVIVDVTGYVRGGAAAEAGTYGPLEPARILDTRSGVGAPAARVAPGQSLALDVTGVGGVPQDGVSAVALNVTAVLPDAEGWLTVSPGGQPVPKASSLNYLAGDIVANLVIAKVGADGTVVLTPGGLGSVDLVVDVAGYYRDGQPLADGGVVPLQPTRAVDTRDSTALAAGESRSVDVTSAITAAGGDPRVASHAVVNLTAVDPSGVGYLTAYESGASLPPTSNLNYAAGRTVAVSAIVPIGADGSISVLAGDASTHLIVDVVGYVSKTAEPSAWAWGANNAGTVGNGTTQTQSVPTLVAGVHPRASDGLYFGRGGYTSYDTTAYAIGNAGELWAWGGNANGQVGDGTTTDRLTPYRLDLPPVTTFVPGWKVAYAITTDGSLYAWGVGSGGLVGDGTTDDRLAPYRVEGLPPVAQVYTTASNTYAVTTGGEVYGWGATWSGQIPGSQAYPQASPMVIDGLTGISWMNVSSFVAYAVTGAGEVYSWGPNYTGQIGNGTQMSPEQPYLIPGLSGVTSIAASFNNTFAVTASGAVYSWGAAGPALGRDESAPSAAPAPVPGLPATSRVELSTSIVQALTTDGRVFGWGPNYYGQAGTATTEPVASPVEVPGISGVADIDVDASTTFAVTTDGSLYGWGSNYHGRIHQDAADPQLTPYEIPIAQPVAEVVIAEYTTFAITTDGRLYSWGDDGLEVLGNGEAGESGIPTAVEGIGPVTQVVSTNGTALAG